MQLGEALEQLDETVSDTLAFFSRLDYSNLTTTLTAFGQLKDHKDRLDRIQETVSKLYEYLDKEKLPDVLSTFKIKSISVGGKMYSSATRINASIPENKREYGHSWLVEEAKIPELIIPRVNPKSLSSFVKNYFEVNGKLPPEEAMTVHLQNYVQVRKA